MSRTKEITEDLGKRVDDIIRIEKVTKPSLKSLDSTNPQSHRLCTNGENSRPLLPFPRSGGQTKISKVPRVSSKQLQAFLTLAKVKVHEPIIRRTLSNHGVHGRAARRKPLFSKNKIAF